MEDVKKVKFLEVRVSGTKLVFAFGNGARVEFDPARANEKVRDLAMYHGFNQKLRDSTAGFSKELDYVGAISAMTEVQETLYAGEWNRAGGGTSGQTMQDLATAISTMKKCSIEKALAAVERATPEARKEWLKNKTVASLVAAEVAKRLKEAAKTTKDELDIDLD